MTHGSLLCRMVHAFTCAGILPTQYINFCKFAGIGGVKKSYIHSGLLDMHILVAVSTYNHCSLVVYKKQQYIDVVKACATLSMEAAVEEVKKLSSYAKDGEVCLVCVVFCSNPIKFFGAVGNNGRSS